MKLQFHINYREYGANNLSKNKLDLDENETSTSFLSDIADVVWAGKLTTKVLLHVFKCNI